ncbi:phytanoyl-CoA dioxygenase family protein [Streptomyces sp. CL12]|uniref:phytanoyl-CoA dioxygenase family protein n=1 Tax=Streptomyces sp. CL12 TaxID=3391744 RepID=UPI003A800279
MNGKLIESDIEDVETVAKGLEEAGVVVVPGFLDRAAVHRTAEECIRLFRQTPSWAHHEEYSLGQSVRMERADIDASQFPAVAAALSGEPLERVVERVFGPDCIFSRTVYAIQDVVGSRTRVQQLHYDKMRHLKAFVYLSDVGPSNGPFHCVPGSHLLTRELEEENRSRRIVPTDDDARELPEDLVDKVVPVTAEAGTLILFDSDIAHHAGIVTSGERLAIRSLSFGSYRREQWYRTDGTPEIAP